MEDDAFLDFVESARLMLLSSSSSSSIASSSDDGHGENTSQGPSWGWTCSRILECCKAYSSGVTPAILLSHLFKAWLEKSRVERGWKCKESGGYNFPGMAVYKRQKQLRTRLPNIVTIDSIYEKKFVSLDAVLEVVILDTQLLSGTSSYLLTLGDAWSSNTIDLYLHRKFYDLIDNQNGILRKGREIRLTECRLRTAMVAGARQARLLPTEYLVVLLDEEQDEDAVLLGAKFCSDTFSTVQLDRIEAGADYCFYARLEKVGEVEVNPRWNHVKEQKLFLCDENHTSMPFVLWDEQISLAGLFSEGSMIALERPFIAQVGGESSPAGSLFCLEYGSATRLYTVPYLHHEEQVTLECTQSRSKSNRTDPLESMKNNNESQNVVSSQMMLPMDSQGSVDFCSFPFRLLVSDVRPKMSNVSLYGVVTSFGECNLMPDVAEFGQSQIYEMFLQDQSGSIGIKICFCEAGRAEELDIGHTIFVSGLKSHTASHTRLECIWNEKNASAELVIMTQLPALLTSPCLYRLVPLSNLSRTCLGIQVCKVQVRNIRLDQVRSRPIHSQCGHYLSKDLSGKYMCRFCPSLFDNEITYGLSMVLHLHDSQDGECIALCSRRPAAEILQASAEDFLSWPEDEQALYLYSLQKEQYLITVYMGSGDYLDNLKESSFAQGLISPWRIGQALKCEL